MADKPAPHRASIFEDEESDLADFSPQRISLLSSKPEEVRAVSENASFRSREPIVNAASTTEARTPAVEPKEIRRYRTGRNVQLNLKVRQADADAFYALADRGGWVLGDAFARAVEALRRETESA